jgi:biopolymer transport protein ExbD
MLVAVLACGCSEPKPVVIASLVVDRTGAYELDGKSIALSELKCALVLLRKSSNTVEVHIHTISYENEQAVSEAILTTQDAGIARVWILMPPRV